jgi:ribosomal protein S18 acetylase RimI-like enzyme
MVRENSLIQRSSSMLHQQGIHLLTSKILTTFYRRMFLMVRPLDSMIPYLYPHLAVVFKRLTEKDLCISSRSWSDQYVNSIRAHLARGEQCFAALYEGQIAQVGRVAMGRVYIPYLRRYLMLQPGDVYFYDSFTLPAYRGYGLAPARAAYMMRHYRQEGYRRVVCLVAVENKSGLRSVQKTGYQSVGLYSCLRFGPWQRDWQQMWSEAPLPMLIGRA